MKSIAYAENKLNAKMGTPQKVVSAKNAPVKYDVEDMSQINTQHLGSLVNADGQDLGDCDIKDEECIAKQHKILADAAKGIDSKNLAEVKKEEPKQAVKVESVAQTNITQQAKPAAVAPMPTAAPVPAPAAKPQAVP